MSELPRETTPWFQTFTGEQINPMTLTPEQINIKDVAHALSLTCRFNGHCNKFYSVLQHCTLGSEVAQTDERYVHLPRLPLLFLLHDASEAYLIDMPRPVKYAPVPWTADFRDLEDRVQGLCWNAFNLAHPNLEEETALKEIDNRMLVTEKRDLLNNFGYDWGFDAATFPFHIKPEQPAMAEEQFLARFATVQQFELPMAI